MMQLKSASSVAQALAVMVEATSFSHADASKLTALLQNSEGEDEDAMGAPAGAVFKSSSGGIVQTLQDLFDKAETQLEDARKTETKAVQAYQMLAQGLKDEIKYGEKDMAAAKKKLADSQEAKATAEGDLSVTSKDLAEELKALATAKKVIVEATSGASDLSYSFLQLSSGADLANFEAVRAVRDLAQKEKSSALAQLASRMSQVMHQGGNSGDVFGKVKGLINNMIEKLLKEAEADATEKAFCDKEMAETAAKKSDKEDNIERLQTQLRRHSVTRKWQRRQLRSLTRRTTSS